MSREKIIRSNFAYLNSRFGDLPYATKSEFSIGDAIITSFSSFSNNQLQKYSEAIAKNIMVYLGLPMLTPSVTINMVEQTNNSQVAGTFNGDITRCHIDLNISPIYNPLNIYAILAHECTHYFLRFHHAEYDNKDDNEILTDCAAVYLGLGNYLYKGYQQISLGNNQYHKIGYITTDEISLLRNLRPGPKTELPDYQYYTLGTSTKGKKKSYSASSNRTASSSTVPPKSDTSAKQKEKKKGSRLTTYILVAVTILALLAPFAYLLYSHIADNNKIEKPYSTEMKNGDKAYIYVTSCEPKYAITENSIVTKTICEATTKIHGRMLIVIPGNYETFMSNLPGSRKDDSEYYTFEKSSYMGDLYKYTFDGSVVLHCRVHETSDYPQLKKQEGNQVVLEVNTDNNPG